MNHSAEYYLQKLEAGELSPEQAYYLIYECGSQRSPVPGQRQDIAVVGFACRFPGAGSAEDFWRNLDNGVAAITTIPAERWDVATVFRQYGLNPATSCCRGGFIPDIDKFDAEFFMISPQEALVMDPQQRLLLQTVWHTLEHAGYSKQALWGSNCGVFIGARAGTYQPIADDKVARATVTGSISNFIAARLSDFYNFKGPSLVFDTACSSSLVSLHYACRSIHSSECDAAIVGGVHLIVSPEGYVSLNKARALSVDGQCHVFDKRANGFVPGEGVGAVYLKPLPRAIADNDRIYAVIKGSAVNNDGHTMGITTPEMQGQQSVIAAALNDAGVSAETISYLEAHGTGTMIGDPIEVKALTNVFRQYTQRKNYCAIGSVKTNIGHLDTAAGVASLIKVVLSLYHRQLPPTLNCHEPNPRFRFIDSPFYPNTASCPWPKVEGVRRAAISSFGFGGTNCHVILEQAPAATPVSQEAPPYYFFTISAATETALTRLCANYRRHLAEDQELAMADLCFTANAGRQHFGHRRAFVCRDSSDLEQQLAANAGISGNKSQEELPLLLMFPGQGALYPGMAQELYRSQKIFRDTIDHCAEILKGYWPKALTDYLFTATAAELKETAITQPVTFAVSYALAQMWLTWGIQPAAVIGHSVGEYVAACVAGFFLARGWL